MRYCWLFLVMLLVVGCQGGVVESGSQPPGTHRRSYYVRAGATFSPDGKLLLIFYIPDQWAPGPDFKYLCIREVETGKEVRAFAEPTRAWVLPEGKGILVKHPDQPWEVQEVLTGKHLWSFDGGSKDTECKAASRDG